MSTKTTSNPSFSQYNAGELSPLLAGRTDTSFYSAGSSSARNMMPLIQGVSMRRPGTRFVARTKDDGKVWLARFVFNAQQSFILEFGDEYIRFYSHYGQVLDGSSPYEIVSPYKIEDMTDADGTFRLRMTHSGDVIYIAHPDYPPHKLTRLGNTNWTITELQTVGGPFLDQNFDDGITVYASGQTGTVTLTANASIFEAGHVGTLFRIQAEDLSAIPPWEPSKKIENAVRRRNDGKTYIAVGNVDDPGNFGNWTGSRPPIHDSGVEADGSGEISNPEYEEVGDPRMVPAGVLWQYEDSGYGIVRITSVSQDGLSATGTVQPPAPGLDRRLPAAVVGSGNATWRWAFGAWSEVEGYPSAVTFFRERLVFGKDHRLDFSVPKDFENFAADTFGEVLPDNAIVAYIASDRVDNIIWMVPQDQLLIGTTSEELACGEMTTNEPFGPDNIKITPQSSYGSSGVPPQRVGERTIFAQRSRKKIREDRFTIENERFTAVDVSVRAEHLFPPGVVDMVYVQEPKSMIWAAREDGMLLAFTYDREQEVLAWTHHPLGGWSDDSRMIPAAVEAVQSIPSPDGAHDDLWLVVRRVVNGEVRRYIEYLTQPVRLPEQWEGEPDDAYLRRCYATQSKVFYVDCGLTYDQPKAIDAISNGNPIVITCPGHGLVDGDSIRIDGVMARTSIPPERSMWELNARIFTARNVTTDTFELYRGNDPVDGTEFGAYAYGGEVRKRVTVISGLDHLEGEAVAICADGGAHPERVVENGQITLQNPAAVVHIGLGYVSFIRAMRIEGGASRGTSQGQPKKIRKIGVRVFESAGFKYGPSRDRMDSYNLRYAGQTMGLPPPLLTGDAANLDWPNGYEYDGYVSFMQDDPLPFTLVAHYPMLEVNEQ